MNPPPSKKRPVAALLVLVALAAGIMFWRVEIHAPAIGPVKSAGQGNTSATNQVASAGVTMPAQPPPVSVTNATKINPPGRLPVPQFSWFHDHPFKVAETNGAYAWTAEDGKDTNVIRQLAHNELEFQRMVNENATIFRRQLVYHEQVFTLMVQEAVQSGRSIQQMTLPGLDGRELQVAVTKTDFESGGDRGLFYGKLPGRADSMVTAAFINGREAFTVISPQDQIYLQGESREPGEIVVKSIDPQTYGGHAD